MDGARPGMWRLMYPNGTLTVCGAARKIMERLSVENRY